MTERDERAAGHSQLVRVVRAWRHGTVNRLQVALGWLQLGRPERAATALAEWCRQLEWEGAVLRHWPGETAAFYLAWRAHCEEAGVEVVWRAPLVQGPAARAAPGSGAPGRPVRPAGGLSRASVRPPGTAAVVPVLEAAREAARRAPGQRIWLRWDGLEGRLLWGLEGDGPVAAGGAAGSAGSTTG